MKIELGQGQFVFDKSSNKLTCRGKSIHLTEKESQVLLELINAPSVVTREELYQRVWRTTFKSDSALSRVIKELRKKFNDDAYNSQYIKTVKEPISGYQFIASIEELPSEEAGKSKRAENKKNLIWTALGGVSLLLITVLAWQLFNPAAVADAPANISLKNITLPKRWYFEISMSHDQKYMANLGNEVGNRSEKKLFVTSNVDGYPVLAEIPEAFSPVFDESNQYLAYAQRTDGECELSILTLDDELNKTTNKTPNKKRVSKCEMADGDISIAWGHEGKFLYVAESGKENLARGLYKYNIETGRRENLLSSKFGGLGIYRVYAIPNKNQLLLLEGEDWINVEVSVLDLKDLKRQKVTSLVYPLLSVAAFEDGFVIRDSINNGLIKIDYETGTQTDILGPQSEMVFVPKRVGHNGISFISGELYQIEIMNSADEQPITSENVDYYPVVQGGDLYFASRRSGRDQIWKLHDGVMSQITNIRFSTLILSFDAKNKSDDEFISVSTSKGIIMYKNGHEWASTCGKEQGATHGKFNNDVTKLMYALPVQDTYQLFECDLDSGNITQLTTQGALVGFYADNDVYFVDIARESLFKISSDGKHKIIGEKVKLMNPHDGVLESKELYFTNIGESGVKALDLTNGKVRDLLPEVTGSISLSLDNDIIFTHKKVVATNPKLLIYN